MKRLTTFPILISLFAVCMSGVSAQEAAKLSATIEPATAKKGETVVVKVTAKMNDKWHIYSTTPMNDAPVATSIGFAKAAPVERVGKIRQPKPIVRFDEGFQINTEFYEDKVTFTLDARIKPDARSPSRSMRGSSPTRRSASRNSAWTSPSWPATTGPACRARL
jgi:hypothetical protein